MPMPAYMDLGSEIPGSVTVAGRENQVEILAFSHRLFMPTDVKDGTAAGTRKHESLIVTKNTDKSSPKLYEYLCNGKKIPLVVIHWYMIDSGGQEKEYFAHKLTNARIVAIKPWMPNVDDKATETYKHMEEIEFRYEKITWTYLDGNVEYSDSWLEGR
ncbi:MAG: Hcp family type VI secretion system effector [Candidatus Desantisbacteria bacterium]